MLGYLFVRGGVHAMAYAKALQTFAGVRDVEDAAIPKMTNKASRCASDRWQFGEPGRYCIQLCAELRTGRNFENAKEKVRTISW